jgi:hypothetical protein
VVTKVFARVPGKKEDKFAVMFKPYSSGKGFI